jgi:hypothetical protein
MGCYLNVKDNMYCCPNKFSIVIIKEKMLDCFGLCAKHTLFYSPPILPNQIVFCEDYPSVQVR